MNNKHILEAALIERQEYLEQLVSNQRSLEIQIQNLQDEIDSLLLRILESSH